jgi:uncharacterized membrane-anchored protein
VNGAARLLMTAGAVIFAAGVVVYLVSKFGLPFGRLPGDISWEGKNFKIFAPITSMIVVSIVLTVILNLISRLGGK